MKPIIISGPPGCGKTHFRKEIAQSLGARPMGDVETALWEGRRLEPGCLYEDWHSVDQLAAQFPDAEVIPFEDACRRAGVTPRPDLNPWLRNAR